MPCSLELTIETLKEDLLLDVTTVCETIVLEVIDNPCAGGSSGDVSISELADNRLERKPDGLYVRDRLDPDPVAYYLLSRG